MQSKETPSRASPFGLPPKLGENKFFAVILAAQDVAARDYLDRPDNLTKEDIEAAWKILSPNGELSIARTELLDQLSIFMPHIDMGTVAHLLGGGGSMNHDKLIRLLWHNEEPALPCHMGSESWSLLDPHGRGSVGLDTVLRMLTTIAGFDKLDADDLNLIRSLLEMSPDSNLLREENWHQLGSWAPKLEVLTPAQRKMLATAKPPTGKGGASAARPRPAGRR